MTVNTGRIRHSLSLEESILSEQASFTSALSFSYHFPGSSPFASPNTTSTTCLADTPSGSISHISVQPIESSRWSLRTRRVSGRCIKPTPRQRRIFTHSLCRLTFRAIWRTINPRGFCTSVRGRSRRMCA
jgi:hypothetical protein